MSASGGQFPPFPGNQHSRGPQPSTWQGQTPPGPPQPRYQPVGSDGGFGNSGHFNIAEQRESGSAKSRRSVAGVLIALLAVLVAVVAGGAFLVNERSKTPPLEKQWIKIQKAAPSDQIIAAFFMETKYEKRSEASLTVTYLVEGKRVDIKGFNGELQKPKELRGDDIAGPADKVDVQRFIDALQRPENQCPDERQLHGWMSAREQGSVFRLGCDKTGSTDRPYDINLVDIGGYQLQRNPGVDAAIDGLLELAKISFPDEVTGLRWMPRSDVSWSIDHVSIIGPKIGNLQRVETIFIDEMKIADQTMLDKSAYDEPFKLSDLDIDKAKATWNYLADLKSIPLATSRAVVYKHEGQMVYGLLWGKENPTTGEMQHQIWVDGEGNVIVEN